MGKYWIGTLNTQGGNKLQTDIAQALSGGKKVAGLLNTQPLDILCNQESGVIVDQSKLGLQPHPTSPGLRNVIRTSDHGVYDVINWVNETNSALSLAIWVRRDTFQILSSDLFKMPGAPTASLRPILCVELIPCGTSFPPAPGPGFAAQPGSLIEEEYSGNEPRTPLYVFNYHSRSSGDCKAHAAEIAAGIYVILDHYDGDLIIAADFNYSDGSMDGLIFSLASFLQFHLDGAKGAVGKLTLEISNFFSNHAIPLGGALKVSEKIKKLCFSSALDGATQTAGKNIDYFLYYKVRFDVPRRMDLGSSDHIAVLTSFNLSNDQVVFPFLSEMFSAFISDKKQAEMESTIPEKQEGMSSSMLIE